MVIIYGRNSENRSHSKPLNKGAFINYHQGGVASKWYRSGFYDPPPPIGGGADSMTPPIRGGVDSMTPPPIGGGADSMTPPIRGGVDSMTPPIRKSATSGHYSL